jgi:peptide/nickel transport system substrate-binding protein
MNRRDFLRTSAVIGSGLLAAHCAPAAPPAAMEAAATAPAVAEAMEKGGTLVYGYGQRTESNLCAIANYGGSSDVYLRRFLAAGLVQINSSLNGVIPDLAESWEFSDSTITFKLRQGVTWHDGAPFTANDVLFTLRAMGHPESGQNYGYGDIKGLIVGMDEFKAGEADSISGVNAPDDYTVTIEMTKPFRDSFLLSIAVPTIIPEHILSEVPVDAYGGAGPDVGLCKTDWGLKTGTGLGAFKLSKYLHNEVVEYDPNPDYFRGEPLLDKLVYLPFIDNQALAAGLEAGEVLVGQLPSSEYERMKDMPHLRFQFPSGTAAIGVAFNQHQPYLQDKRVRQALMYGLDREQFLQTVWYDLGDVPEAAFYFGEAGVSPDARQYPYDPDKARELLAEAGWDSSQTLRLLWDDLSPFIETWFSFMIGYWKEIGVEAEPHPVGAEYASTLEETHDWDIMPTSFGYGISVNQIRSRFDNENWLGVAYPEAVELIDKALLAEGEEFQQLVWQLQEIAAEELPVAYHIRQAQVYAINKRVNGDEDFQPVYALMTRNYWGMEKVWVADEAG